MMRRKLFFLVMFCGFLFSGQFLLMAAGRSSPVAIKIVMSKSVYRVGDPIQGQVIITQRYASNIPAVFEMTLIHDNKVVKRSLISMKRVPGGRTQFSFGRFGIPQFNTSTEAKGNWTIKDWLPGERRHTLIGVHGGTSEAEMRVPLLAIDA